MEFAITHRPTLNQVAQAVKGIMLTYPASYTCRMDVLATLFLKPTTNLLNPDGTVDLSDFGELLEQMDYCDIDGLLKPEDVEVANSPSNSMAGYFAGKLVGLKRQRRDRELVAQYIDILAVEHTRGENFQKGTKITAEFRANACLLDNVDVTNMAIEWAFAAEEVITAAITGLVNQLGMGSPFFRSENAAPALLATLAHLNGYLDRLDQVTGTKNRLLDQSTITDELISEVLAEASAGYKP